MKTYKTPEIELLALYAKDAIMASGEPGPNETDRDNFMPTLSIEDIGTV